MKDLDPWITTFAGKQVWPWEPTVEQIEILDIGVALSRIPRFGGHTKYFYSVAQHCVLGSHLIDDEFALEFLLHDAAEAYVGDILGPIKQYLKPIHAAEEAIMVCVREKFGLASTMSPEVHEMDMYLLVQEAHQLVLANHDDWHLKFGEPDEAIGDIVPLDHNSAYREFMARFLELKGDG